MSRELVNLIPFWVLMFSFVTIFMLISYLSACLSVYFFSSPVDKEHRQIANTLIAILSGGFSILLAFIIINAWNYLMDARNNTSKEADCLAVFIRNIAIFPPAIKAKLMKDIQNYTVTVRVDEWKAMRDGKESEKAWDELETLYADVQVFHPISEQEILYYSEVLANLNELLQTRRERLNKLESVIPDKIKQSLFLGSLVLIILLGFIRGERNLIGVTPVLLFAASLGFNLALAMSIDYPYSGGITVSNKLFYGGALGKFPD